MSEKALAKKAVTSVAWTYLSYGLGKVVVLISTAVLARLITQDEFGIVGYAVTAMGFLDMVREVGFGMALIQRRDRIEEACDTTFWFGMATNIMMWVFTIILAPFVAAFFHEDQLKVLLPTVSLSFLATSFVIVHDALLQREMKFARRIIPTLGETLIKAVISIGLALAGYGVWSLVIGQVVGRSVNSILLWYIIPWRPSFRFYPDIAREMFNYGYKIAIDNFLSNLQANIDYVFIGRFLGAGAMGTYTVAYKIPELVIINFCNVIANVMFPTYSIMQEDRDMLRKGMFTTLRYVSLVTLPAGVGLALISSRFVGVIFGPGWEEAAPMMSVLSLYGAALAISWNIGDVYKAIARPDVLWKTAVFEFAVLLPVLYVLSHHSALAVAMGHLSVALLVTSVRLVIASRLVPISLPEMLKQFVPAFICTIIMAICVGASLYFTANAPDLIAVIVAVVSGAYAYAGTLIWFERELIVEIQDQVSWRSVAMAERSMRIVSNRLPTSLTMRFAKAEEGVDQG